MARYFQVGVASWYSPFSFGTIQVESGKQTILNAEFIQPNILSVDPFLSKRFF
jgi:hypothetical protein